MRQRPRPAFAPDDLRVFSRSAQLRPTLRLALQLASAAALLCAGEVVPTAAAATPAVDTDQSRKEAAGVAVRRGQAAFQAGDYAAAIEAFTEADKLRPAAKLDYNIGICHQRLHESARSSGDADAEKLHANAAIDAYNRYLIARPTADDRPQVEDLIRQLGGVPATAAALKPAPDRPRARPPAEDPDEPDDPDDPSEDPPQETSPERADPDSAKPSEDDPRDSVEPPAETAADLPPPRGSFTASLGLWILPQTNDHPTVEAGSMGVLSLRGGAYLGAQRRLFAGGGIAVAGGGAKQPNMKLGSAAQAFDALFGLRLPLGSAGRVVLPITAIVGAGREALRIRGEFTRPACAVGSGTLVGARWGGRLGGRVGALILLGARRKHGLAVDLDAVATLSGAGPVADGCGESLFTSLALPRVRASVGLTFGYTVRW